MSTAFEEASYIHMYKSSTVSEIPALNKARHLGFCILAANKTSAKEKSHSFGPPSSSPFKQSHQAELNHFHPAYGKKEDS